MNNTIAQSSYAIMMNIDATFMSCGIEVLTKVRP